MSVLLGGDGTVQLDLGSGLTCVVNLFRWQLNINRDVLDTTRQGAESKGSVGGLLGGTGELGYRLQLFEDGPEAVSAYQILDYVLTNVDAALTAQVRLVLQVDPSASCAIGEPIREAVWLDGSVVIGSTSIDCSDPGQLMVLRTSITTDGDLTLNRGVLP